MNNAKWQRRVINDVPRSNDERILTAASHSTAESLSWNSSAAVINFGLICVHLHGLLNNTVSRAVTRRLFSGILDVSC